MEDAAAFSRLLWRHWLPRGVRQTIGRCAPDAERLFVFLAAAHDLGKAIPAFQLGRSFKTEDIRLAEEPVRAAGLTCKPLTDPKKIPHGLASQLIAEKHGLPRSLAVVLGGHHGVPPSLTTLQEAPAYPRNLGWKDPAWLSVQDEFWGYAFGLAGLSFAELKDLKLTPAAQMILTGLVIMTDWLVSDGKLFPQVWDDAQRQSAAERAKAAWERLQLPPCWEALDADTLAGFDLYTERFGFSPRAVQKAVADTVAAAENLGIVIIEAPMGEGKTEAALVAAELLASKTGRGGVYFGLPTQATSDGIFPRMLDWIHKIDVAGDVHSIVLAHGKSRFNEQYKGVHAFDPHVNDDSGDSDDNVIVHEWFRGRKKSLLADFAVGTVDQILMCGLKRKHLALRHLGLANKVVIIDECHAYDAYMNSYLFKALGWLGAYGVPVVVLSATLPADTRRRLTQAYLCRQDLEPGAWAESRAYPLVTYTDGDAVHQAEVPPGDRNVRVALSRLDDDAIADKLDELLIDGGCAAVVVNTVKRAQAFARALAERFGDETVLLLHARFLAGERALRENRLRQMLGRDGASRPPRLIVVGTQVIEQSLDLDFDVLFSDICPMDLLLQRMGRLQRHERERLPLLRQARCFVLGIGDSGFDSGAEAIYGKFMLMRTAAILPDSIVLPRDIPELVQTAYGPDSLGLASSEYEAARKAHDDLIVEKEYKAKAFQVRDCYTKSDLVGLLDTSISDASGKRGEAAVRDAGESIEVIVIQRRGDGRLYTLPFLAEFGGAELPRTVIAASEPQSAPALSVIAASEPQSAPMCTVIAASEPQSAPTLSGITEELAGFVAGCTVKLPPALATPWNIDKTIGALEESNKGLPNDWQNSPWLKDELFLVLDEDNAAVLNGYKLTYDRELGLIAERIQKGCEE
jgi:CRISPR-associated endonuclease/helicase Cas3